MNYILLILTSFFLSLVRNRLMKSVSVSRQVRSSLSAALHHIWLFNTIYRSIELQSKPGILSTVVKPDLKTHLESDDKFYFQAHSLFPEFLFSVLSGNKLKQAGGMDSLVSLRPTELFNLSFLMSAWESTEHQNRQISIMITRTESFIPARQRH